MTWHINKSLSGSEVVLLDEKSLPVAKFSFGGWTLSRAGKIEFMGDRKINQEMMDELLVTGAAVMQAMVNQAAAGAAGAGGGGA
jgi:hypothetical protein